MRRILIAVTLIALVWSVRAEAAEGTAKQVTVAHKGMPVPITRNRNADQDQAPPTRVTTSTTSTTTTTRPTTTTAPKFAATLASFSATTTAAGTHYVTATLSWTPMPGATIMACVLNVTSNGGSCIGLGVPATSTYTTSPDLVGEIPGGTELEYYVRACNGACVDSNRITVNVG